jgi:hypothetical protein
MGYYLKNIKNKPKISSKQQSSANEDFAKSKIAKTHLLNVKDLQNESKQGNQSKKEFGIETHISSYLPPGKFTNQVSLLEKSEVREIIQLFFTSMPISV